METYHLIQVVMNHLKFIIFRLLYLAEKKSGILDRCRYFSNWSTNSAKAMPSRYLTKYNTLRDNPFHMHTLNTNEWTETVVLWLALSIMFKVICYAPVWCSHLYLCSNVVCSCSRCYHNTKSSLVIVNTLVLGLEAVESFMETRQCN